MKRVSINISEPASPAICPQGIPEKIVFCNSYKYGITIDLFWDYYRRDSKARLSKLVRPGSSYQKALCEGFDIKKYFQSNPHLHSQLKIYTRQNKTVIQTARESLSFDKIYYITKGIVRDTAFIVVQKNLGMSLLQIDNGNIFVLVEDATIILDLFEVDENQVGFAYVQKSMNTLELILELREGGKTAQTKLPCAFNEMTFPESAFICFNKLVSTSNHPETFNLVFEKDNFMRVIIINKLPRYGAQLWECSKKNLAGELISVISLSNDSSSVPAALVRTAAGLIILYGMFHRRY